MNYDQSIAFLNRCINYERLGFERLTVDRHLDEFSLFLNRLGDPQNDLSIIHVAGTKGKGSTALFLAAALESNGYSTGLYTSPHIEDYTERIRVGLKDISREVFGRLLARVVSHYPPEKQHDHAGFRTVFELLTAMAFVHFRDCSVDFVILETGLGGRLDATNVVDPLMSVITTLGLEHTEILGRAIEQIAYEKAGIIKPERPVVFSRQQPRWQDAVTPVIETKARECGSPMHHAWELVSLLERMPGLTPFAPQKVTFKPKLESEPPITFTVPLAGEHQAVNLQTALATLSILKTLGWSLNQQRTQIGIENCRINGRIEVLHTSPPLVLDCAHCPSSFRALMSTMSELFPESAVILLMGLARRKQRHEIFEMLAGIDRIKHVVFYPLPSPRSESPQELAESAKASGLFATACDSIPQALDNAMALHSRFSGSVIIGAGSFYGMGPLRREWERRAASQAV